MRKLMNGVAAVMAAAVIIPCFGALNVSAAAPSGIKIDKNNFPDDNFRAILSTATYDTDRNGYFSQQELNSVYNIHIENSNVESVEGIEYFTELQGMWCLNNSISDWDLSKNTHLKGVWCSYNDFTKLDFTANKELEWVYCYNCQLTELDISDCPALGYIECNANPDLKNLYLKGCPNLENLFCSSCGLTSLDLSGNPKLCELDAFKNDLTSINFSNNLELKRLDIWDNWNLGDVDISMLKGLQFYNCAKTNATKLDMSHNPELTMLVASYNENLKSINLKNNPKLAYLNLECDWRLPSLDISQNPKLYHFYAFGLRSISTLNIGNNPRLVKTYNEGVYKDEPQLGYVHSYTLNYGGSGDYFDDLRHEFVVDNDVTINTKAVSGGAKDSPDTWVDTNDGHSNSESFATRGEAIQLLYEMAGSPNVSGTTRFTDISGSPYKKAIMWGEQHNLCFGSPNICSDTFKPNDLICKEDFALMAHRFAEIMGFGTAFDYGRSDWFDDFYDIEYYAWGAFTWSLQWEVITTSGNNMCYPHGRLTKDELKAGANQIFKLDGHASYSAIVDGNGNSGSTYYNPATAGGTGYVGGGSSGSGSAAPAPAYKPSSSNSANSPYSGGSSKPSSSSSSSSSGSSSKPSGSSNSGSSYGGDSSKPSAQVSYTPTETSGGFEDFVERLYVVALGRASEPEGKAFWCEHVGNGDLTGAECANEFLLSKEFNNRYLDDENFLKVLYGTFFNRKAEDDKDGFNFWMECLKTQGRDSVVDCFINSEEWCNVCASYGVKSGATRAKATVASKNATEFAARLYTECLGREAETDGLKFWSLGLTNLELTGKQAAHEFFFSKEFNDHNYGNEELLTRMYKTFMGRNPDTDGMNYWLGEMKNGMTKEQVFDSFVNSAEFTQICKDYAIDRG